MQLRSWLAIMAIVVGLGVLPAHGRMGGSAMPEIVRLEGCVLPAEECGWAAYETIKLLIKDESRRFAVSQFQVVTGSRLGSSVLSELSSRPVRVNGADDLLAPFVPGARLEVRAMLRGRRLIIQSVEPVPTDAE